MEHIKGILEREGYQKTTGPQRKSSEKMMIDEDIIRDYEEQKAMHGYAANPHCRVCYGAGYVHPLFPDGKPDYSRVINCQAEGCIESQKRIYESTEAYAKDKGVSKFNTFDNWKPVLGAETTLEAFRDIAFNEGAPPLLLVYGMTGNGKTMLCEATVIQLLKRGVDCRLWAVADLVSKLKESISENTTELLMTKLKKLPALVLDEWGQNYGSPWEEQKLEELVVAREREGLITIITTNLEPEDPKEDRGEDGKGKPKARIPERIVSRFRDKAQARMILNKALDYRPKKKTKAK